MPGVDFQTEGYVSLAVAPDAGWAGGGFNQSHDARIGGVENPNGTCAGMDLSGVNSNTRLHLAFRASGSASNLTGLHLHGRRCRLKTPTHTSASVPTLTKTIL